jgi:hypothetical protein
MLLKKIPACGVERNDGGKLRIVINNGQNGDDLLLNTCIYIIKERKVYNIEHN